MEAAAKKPKVGNDLTQGSIYKTLIVFAVPIILTNLIQQLYSMVDLMVIGQFVGSVGTVGISTGGEIADLVTPVAMGFSTAGQIYIAQLIGARNERRAKDGWYTARLYAGCFRPADACSDRFFLANSSHAELPGGGPVPGTGLHDHNSPWLPVCVRV